MSENSKGQNAQNIIVLRSVFGKVGQHYYMNPAKDKYGNYPECVKKVDSNGDMILSDSERNDPNKDYFIPENKMFDIVDGQTFDLDKVWDKNVWDAIKNCQYIAPNRFAKDANGNYLIDGTPNKNAKTQRYGIAELYVDMPGVETANRVSRKKKIHQAAEFIYTDDRGAEGRLLKARLLGKHMQNMPDSDIEDYLLTVAEKHPEKIIELYTGGDTNLRILFVDARDKKVIIVKDKLYMYGSAYVLGATDDSVINWMKNPKNKKVLELIQKDTYPDMYETEQIGLGALDDTPSVEDTDKDPIIEKALKSRSKNK